MIAMPPSPPRKAAGRPMGQRTIDGLALDVRHAARFLGGTEKQVRAMVARRLIPHRRLGGRIIFLRPELEQWLASLPGCPLAEAHASLAIRTGKPGAE